MIRDEYGVSSAVGGGPPTDTWSRDELIDRLATAKCERHYACGRVGPVGQYASRDECFTEERKKAAETLQCSTIDSAAARACVESATTPACSVVVDTTTLPIVGRCTPSLVCQQAAFETGPQPRDAGP